MTRTLRVAGAQLRGTVGDRDGNLARATDLASRAAAAGAQLVLFPELMPSGYTLSPLLWDAAEPGDGPTAQWLAATSARLGVYLGTSFVELDGRDVWNTFVLTGPDGAELGRVRKRHAETYFFRGARGSHVIETPIGRIGVGICADNHYGDVARQLATARLDLLLMPHAGPAACVVGGSISAADVRGQHERLRSLAPWYAERLGVPVVFVNQSGPMVGRGGTGLLGSMVESAAFHLPGLSTIADSDGRVVDHVGEGDGLVVADVTLDPARVRCPDLRGRFVTPGWGAPMRTLVAVDGALGRVYYATHARRRAAAGHG